MLKTKRFIAAVVTALMLIGMMPMFVFADVDVSNAIVFNESTPADVYMSAGEYPENVAKFTPSESGEYIFTVEAMEGHMVIGWLYDNAERTNEAICSGCDYNFVLSADLIAGKTYYMFFYCHEMVETGFNVNLYVRKAPTVKSIEISGLPFEMTCLDNMLGQFNFWGLEVKATFTDESIAYFRYEEPNPFYDYMVECEIDQNGVVTVSLADATTTFEIEVIKNPIKSFEYVGKAVELVENTYGHNSEAGYYIYNLDSFVNELGKVFKVTYKDGSTKMLSLFDYEEFVLEQYMYLEDDQYLNAWEKGETNQLIVHYAGFKTIIPIKIVESNVKSIKIDKAPSFVYTYGDFTYGYYWDEGYSLYARNFDDLKFTITYKDGSKKTYYGKDIDINSEKLDGVYCAIETYVDEPAIGKNKITLNYNGYLVNYDVTVKKTDVKSIAVTKKPTTLTFDEYYSPSFAGAEVTLTKANGSKQVVKITKDNIYLEAGNLFVEDEAGNTVLFFEQNYDYENNRFVNYTLYCYDVSTEVNFMQYQNNQYDSIELINPNIDFKDMSIVVSKGGVKETIKLVDDIEFYGGGFGGPDMKPCEFNTFTAKGVVHTTIIALLNRNAPVAYEAYAFGNMWCKEMAQELVLKGISIAKESDKVRYKKGEKFEPEGIEITLDFGGGIKGLARYGEAGVTVGSVDTSKVGTKTVTVTYEGKKATFEIKVADGFSDVKKGSWYEEYVNYAASYGIFDGTDDAKNTFSPNDQVTRAQFVKILANMAGVDTSNNNIDAGFKDVPKGKWYTGAVKWASENEITAGMGDGTFKPDEKITREQMCVMLTSFVEDFNGTVFKKIRAGTAFKDDSKVSSWAKDSVDKCQRATLIGGLGDGSFGPKQTATRAQAATIFATFHLEMPVW